MDSALPAPLWTPLPSFTAAAESAKHTLQCSAVSVLCVAQILKADQKIKTVLSQSHTFLVP